VTQSHVDVDAPARGSVVDRSDPRALWRQVADVLAVDVGERSRPGSRLESEAALGRRLGVSRVTVRQALSHLAERGVVVPQAGRGWFAAPSEQRSSDALYEPPGLLQSFTEMARSRGIGTDSVVLEQRVRPATLDEAELLAVAPGAPLLSLRRLRRLDGLPVAVDHSLLPAHLLPDAESIDFATASLYTALRAERVRPVQSHYEVQAEAATSEIAGLLGVTAGFPVLAARQVAQDSAGRPIERGHITYRGDRYRFRAVLRA